MDREVAIDITNEWHEHRGDGHQDGAFQVLQQALQSLVPDPDPGCWAADVEREGDDPRVLLVAGTQLFIVRVQGGSDPSVNIDSVNITGGSPSVSLAERAGHLGQMPTLLREWSFRLSADQAPVLVVSTVERAPGSGGGRPRSDDLARVVAQIMGWTVPSSAA